MKTAQRKVRPLSGAAKKLAAAKVSAYTVFPDTDHRSRVYLGNGINSTPTAFVTLKQLRDGKIKRVTWMVATPLSRPVNLKAEGGAP